MNHEHESKERYSTYAIQSKINPTFNNTNLIYTKQETILNTTRKRTTRFKKRLSPFKALRLQQRKSEHKG